MGWFSQGAEPSKGPRPSSDGAYEAPNRTDRAHCWESRDNFFRCLDSHDILDSIKDKALAEKHCGKEGLDFEKDCVSSWVQYFKKRRVVEYNKAQTLKRLESEGAQPLQPGAR